MNSRVGRGALSVLVLGAALPVLLMLPGGSAAAAAGCDLPDGVLTPADLPAGESVLACDAIGRVVRQGGLGATVPSPGTTVGSSEVTTTGAEREFEISVSSSGIVTYPSDSDSIEEESFEDEVTPQSIACTDGSYSTADRKEYGTYNWYLGDGGMPGALTKAEAVTAFTDAINNITALYNDCGQNDTVDARASYQGQTTLESDMNASGDCLDRDEKSTWDAGDLAQGTVAKACYWTVPTPLIKNDLVEADVRFNTTDYDFTNNPTSTCNQKYDIRSVGTHEAGHVFGMGHVGTGHATQTMYTKSFICTTTARTLGKGDIAGLRSMY